MDMRGGVEGGKQMDKGLTHCEVCHLVGRGKVG